MANETCVMVTSSTTITTTSETVAATGTTVTENNPGGQGVIVYGVVNVTSGTLTTALVIRVRQNSLTGSVVGAAQTITTTATNSVSIPFHVLDTATLTGPINYVVTVQQTGASANGTVNFAAIDYTAGTSVS